jgi:NADPH:quinone reductase-like Zn-dependent oxidoreductase
MPDILQQKTLPMPSAPKDGYLVRVAAVGINPADYKNVDPSGPTFAIRMPVIPCSDFSGVVVGGPEDGLEVYGHIPTEETLLWHVSLSSIHLFIYIQSNGESH